MAPLLLISIFYFLLLSLSSLIFFLLLRTTYLRRLRLPPGNLHLPFIGETLQLIAAYRTTNPEPFIDDRVKRFGPIFTTHIFGEPTVFSTEPETNRFILQNEGKLFQGSYPSSITNLLGKHSLLLLKTGAMHKKLHSLTMSFCNSSALKDRVLGDVDRLIRFSLEPLTGRVLLVEEAKKITFDLMVQQLMSIDPGDWSESLRKEYVLVIQGFFTLPSSILSPTYRKAIKARTKVAEELSKVVRQRRRQETERKNDILGALLATGGDHDRSLSDEEIVDFMVGLLVAGYDTTSTVMTLAIKLLTQTPLALAQLKEEQEKIRAKLGKLETLEWKDYKAMTFTQCVINETLRVTNIIGGVFRRTTKDVNIQGYTIPKGWKVLASFRAVHLDDDNFTDARTFNPWRWMDTSCSTNPNNVFTPFGGGPRLCPGYELARVEIAVFLHHFVTRYSWIPAEEDKLVFFPTTRMQKQYPIIVQRIN